MTAKVGQGIDRIAESRPVRHGRAEGGRLLEIRFHPPFHCQALVDIGQQIPVQALRVGLLRRRFRSGKRFESRIALQLLGEAAAQRSERLPDSGLPVDQRAKRVKRQDTEIAKSFLRIGHAHFRACGTRGPGT